MGTVRQVRLVGMVRTQPEELPGFGEGKPTAAFRWFLATDEVESVERDEDVEGDSRTHELLCFGWHMCSVMLLRVGDEISADGTLRYKMESTKDGRTMREAHVHVTTLTFSGRVMERILKIMATA